MSVGEGATVHKLVSDGKSISSSSVKTANNKILVSGVFNDRERTAQNDRLPLTCPWASLFRAANAFRVTWSDRVFFSPQVCHRNASTKIAREDAVQGLGMAMSTVVSETETGNCCLSAKCFTNSDISACCFTSISRA